MITNKLTTAIVAAAVITASSATAQNVGIGTDTPLSKLHVEQPTSGTMGLIVNKNGQEDGGWIGVNNTAGGFGNALELYYNSNTIGSSAMWMRTWGGFGGLNIDNYGNAFGAQIWNRLTTNTNASLQINQDGLGRGISVATTTINTDDALFVLQDGTGAAGYLYSTSGVGVDIYGGAGDGAYVYSNDGMGVYGYANDANSTSRSGVYGRATGFSGVTGSTGSGSTFGVFSFGDYGGTGAKYFVIDHPIEPETKMLKHFCVESDEPMLMYRGKATFDASGKAVVELEDYITAINTDYTYNLTPIGQFMQLYVETEVDNNGQFTIAGGAPGAKVSWIVYGQRNDAYIQANPDKLNVEMDKPTTMVGKYLDPASHGAPAEQGYDYVAPSERYDADGKPVTKEASFAEEKEEQE